MSINHIRETEFLSKLPNSALIADLLYYKEDHKTLMYIAEELDKIGVVVDKPLHLWLVDFVKENY